MSDFVALQNYRLQAEAEMNAELLRAEGIPAFLQGPQPGIFGAGFSGQSVQGVTLMVPEEHAERAREILGAEETED